MTVAAVIAISLFAVPFALGLRDVVLAAADAHEAMRRRRIDRRRRERLGLTKGLP